MPRSRGAKKSSHYDGPPCWYTIVAVVVDCIVRNIKRWLCIPASLKICAVSAFRAFATLCNFFSTESFLHFMLKASILWTVDAICRMKSSLKWSLLSPSFAKWVENVRDDISSYRSNAKSSVLLSRAEWFMTTRTALEGDLLSMKSNFRKLAFDLRLGQTLSKYVLLV